MQFPNLPQVPTFTSEWTNKTFSSFLIITAHQTTKKWNENIKHLFFSFLSLFAAAAAFVDLHVTDINLKTSSSLLTTVWKTFASVFYYVNKNFQIKLFHKFQFIIKELTLPPTSHTHNIIHLVILTLTMT